MDIPEETTESILLHPMRRKIYSVICLSPCANFTRIAEFLNASGSTLSWHLKRLEFSGLIKSIKFSGRRIYVPTELRDEEAEEIIAIFENDIAKKIFLFVMNNPDTYPLDIARSIDPPIHHETVRYHLDRMRRVGLVEITKDAKIVRVREGERATELRKAGINTLSESFVNFLMDHLRNGCLYPEILEKNDSRLVLRIDCPDGDEIIFDLKLSQWNFMEVINKEKDDSLDEEIDDFENIISKKDS